MIPVIYLHGFASGPSSQKARFFRARLEQAGVLVTVPDLADGDFEHLTVTRQLNVLADTAGSSPVRLIGSSMGGWLAALFAARQPSVDRMVLLAPAFGFNRRWPERMGRTEMERWRRGGRIDVYHFGETRTRQLSFDLIQDAAEYEDFPQFRQPALLFHGIHDDVVPVQYSEEFAARNPNVRLQVVDAGHDLLNVLEEIGPTIVEFLSAPHYSY